MADAKISALTAAGTLGTGDLVPVVQGGTTKKATVAQVRAGMVPAGGAANLTVVTMAAETLTGQVSVPVTGATVTIADNTSSVLILPAGTLAALTVRFPAIPLDGQLVEMAFGQIITTLTLDGNGTTVAGPLSAATANGFGRWRYRLATTTWHRVG